MTNAAVQHKKITVTEWGTMLRSFREQVQSPVTRTLLASTVGEDALEAYLGGQVGIGGFAKLVGFPATTVRHYVELGLIHPFSINGKFRFALPNQLEFMHVRQSVDMGVSLFEIASRMRANPSAIRVLPPIECELEPSAVIPTMHFPNPSGQSDGNAEAVLERLGTNWDASLKQTTAETAGHIAALEGRQRELALKLERARALKASLEKLRDTFPATKH